MSFGDEIEKATQKINNDWERAMRGAAISCFSQIIKASPVDTGRFRGNWFASGLSPSSKVTESKDENGNATVENMTEVVIRVKDWHQFFLTNNLPYAEVIEYGGFNTKTGQSRKTINGYSRQAPTGVVRNAIARTARNLEKVKL